MHIELHRTFRELLIDKQVADARPLLPGNATVKLAALLDEPRVVILSEGGSGKTHEIRQAARRLRADGKAAFFLRLEHVVYDFALAFVEGDLQGFQAWLASPDPGWLLLDSIDESRLRSPGEFAVAMKRVSERLAPAKQRVRLLVTGRTAAWRPKSDLELCNDLFPITNELAAESEGVSGAQAMTPERGQSHFKFFTLEDLSEDQVRAFASWKGVRDTKAFVDGIDRADARAFTTRPQDLLELSEYWIDNGRIGSRLDLMCNSVKRRLRAGSQDRAEARPLPDKQALEGAQIIAGALVLTHVQNIRVPDGDEHSPGLDLREVMQGWTDSDIGTLLQRPLFDQDNYSTVRFHHRSVKEYLAAQWFLRLLCQDVSRRRVEELFFREQYGLEVVVPSLRPLLPWLAMADDRILKRVRRVAPEVVFEGGDPVRLPPEVRREILEQVCDQIASGTSRRSTAELSAIKRFAAPDLTDTLRRLVRKHRANDDIVFVLMSMVWQGRLVEALPEVMDVARFPAAGTASRIAAVRAIAEVGTPKDMASIREAFADESRELDRKCMAELVSLIEHPDEQTLQWLVDCIPRLAKFNEYEFTGLSEAMASFFERADVALVASAIDRLQAFVVEPPVVERHYAEISKRYQWLLECLSVAVRRLMNARDAAALKTSSLAVLHVLPIQDRFNTRAIDEKKLGLPGLVRQWPELNWALFWYAIGRERKSEAKKGGRVVDAGLALVVPTYVQFDGKDFDAAIEAIGERTLADDKEVALSLAFRLYKETGSKRDRAAQLKNAVGHDKLLNERLASLKRPPNKDAATKQMEREIARLDREAKARATREKKARLAMPAKLQAQIGTLRNTSFKNPLSNSWAPRYLFARMREMERNKASRWTDGHWRSLEPEFGASTLSAFRDGMVRFWRGHVPKLPSEGAAQESSLISDDFGLAGLTAEVAGNPAMVKSLSEAEVALAFRYAMRDLSGFPPWFPALWAAHAGVVRTMVLVEVISELRDDQADAPSHGIISQVSFAGDWLWDAIAPEIVELLRTHPPRSTQRLKHMIDIVLPSKLSDATVAALAAEKTLAGGVPIQLGLWAATWTGVAPNTAIDAVQAHLARLGDAEQRTEFTMHYVTYLLGGRLISSRIRAGLRTPAVLSRLYMLVHEHVRSREDIERANKGAYSPGLRDDAQDARERLVAILTEIPGRDAYLALKDISERHPEPNMRPWLKLQARMKAEADSERPPWHPEQVGQFNRDFERTPANHRELFDLAVLRLLDLKHELEDGDNSTATLVTKADTEPDLRNWISAWCQDGSGRYMIHQEVELPDAKRPDLSWTCSGFTGRVPTELKIADNWTGPQLFERLERQLAGDYLRDDASNRGIYLLVWRGDRGRWRLPSGGEWANFGGLVKALQAYWASVADANPLVEEVKVIGIDLTKRTGVRATRKKPASKKTTSKKSVTNAARQPTSTAAKAKASRSKRASAGPVNSKSAAGKTRAKRSPT